MGRIVALEGIDGSGKGTQSRRLVERLRSDGRSAELISFPRYSETTFGRAIGDFLNGRFGQLDEVNPFLASLLYAGDRFESRDALAQAVEANDVVVLDRYVSSNVAHQAAKLDQAGRKELVEWVETVEFEVFRLPRPDLSLLLDMPSDVAQTLIAKKDPRSYTDKDADLHEADAGYLERVRGIYIECAGRCDDWVTIACAAGSEPRSEGEIGDEIWDAVAGMLERRTMN